MFTSVYLLLLLLLVLFSWIANVYGVMLPNGEMIPSLLSADSFRWFVRYGVGHVADAPIVQVLFVLLMVGAARGCGLLRHLKHLIYEREYLPLTRRQRYAARVSWGIFVLSIFFVLSGVLLPGGSLLSVTGRIVGGPLSRGWLFLLCIVVCVSCWAYGRLSGLWYTERGALQAFTSEIARCSHYFVTLIVASQLVAALHYVHIFDLLGWGAALTRWCVTLLYGLPLVIALVRDGGQE